MKRIRVRRRAFGSGPNDEFWVTNPKKIVFWENLAKRQSSPPIVEIIKREK